MISSALYRLFGMAQISSVGFLPLSIWTKYFGLGQGYKVVLLEWVVAQMVELSGVGLEGHDMRSTDGLMARINTNAEPRRFTAGLTAPVEGRTIETVVEGSMNSDRLVIVSAGKTSLHPRWYEWKSRSYDIVALVYDDSVEKLARTADHVFERTGTKWELMTWFFENYQDLWRRYKYFWLVDDDLLCDGDDVDRLFSAASRHELALCQPSLTRSSFYSHGITVHRRAFEYRRTNFVECMCPLFERRALEKVLGSFGESRSGWGLDYVWAQVILKGERIGVIDEVAIEHSRPINAPRRGQAPTDDASFYSKFAIDPWGEMEAVIAKYGLAGRAEKELSGRLRSGREIGRAACRFVSRLDKILPF